MWKIIYLPTGELVGDSSLVSILTNRGIKNSFKTKSAAKLAIKDNLTVELADRTKDHFYIIGDNMLCLLWKEKISSDWFSDYNKKYNHLFDVVNIKNLGV